MVVMEKGGGVILPPFLPSVILEDYKDGNNNYGGDIYDSGDVLDHNYCFKYRSITGTGAGEGEPLAIN